MSTPAPAPSFLARNNLLFFLPVRWRLPNYAVIFLAVFFCLPIVAMGARRAILTNNNDARDWLPPAYDESRELQEFQKYFIGEQFALVSWDGCTLGNTQKLELLAEKLVPKKAVPEQAKGRQYFADVITGPQVIEQLTAPPLSLSYDEAVKRLEGSLVGPDLTGEGHAGRVTCLIATLSPTETETNKDKKAAIEAIITAAQESGVPLDDLHMGGPPVDNVAIDVEGERTLIRLALLSGLTGLGLSYLCFRSLRLTLMIFAVGVLSAGLSLAVVYYYGIFVEVGLYGMERPRIGTVDAILMSMPAVVYVLGLSSAIHIVNYFRDARREHGLAGAAEAAIRHGWKPCLLAALTTAVGLASLYTSDILPIKKFGVYSAVGVVGTLALLFTLLPAALHRFPPRREDDETGPENGPQAPPLDRHPRIHALAHRVGHGIIKHNGWVLVGAAVVMIGCGYGLTKIQTTVQLLKLFDEEAPIIKDYAWLEEKLGNLVPMEIVLRVDQARLRAANEDPEASGTRYEMNLLERLQMVERVQRRIENLPEVGRALSAATLGPKLPEDAPSLGRGFGVDQRRVMSGQLEKHRDEMVSGDYLRDELDDAQQPTAELWRISARLGALNDVDYGAFVEQIRNEVEPVIDVYRRRDQVLKQLHAQGKTLRQANLTIVYEDPAGDAQRNPETHPGLFLGKLLREAGARVTYFNAAKLDALPAGPPREQAVAQVQAAFAKQDAVILAPSNAVAPLTTLAAQAPLAIDLSQPQVEIEPPRSNIAAIYTGLVPLVYKTQRELLVSLRESIQWATVLIAVVMMVVMRSLPAGLVAMIPNVFPVVVVFGALGWLGVKIDIGIMMTASVALGVAVDDTVHFWTWFRAALDEGLDRQAAVMAAYERCATAMFQTTIVGGLGLAVFATSTFTPTQQFGYMMITLLSAALVGDLIVLPALLASPVGRFFKSGAGAVAAESGESSSGSPNPTAGSARHDLPHSAMRR